LLPVRGIREPRFELLDELQVLRLDALEVREESLVELVEIALAMNADRPCQVVEAVERALVEAEGERLGERRRLLRAHLHLARTELIEERDERGAHGTVLPRLAATAARVAEGSCMGFVVAEGDGRQEHEGALEMSAFVRR